MTRGIRFVCDVSPTQGLGHLVRSSALAVELASRGHHVTVGVVGDVALAESFAAGALRLADLAPDEVVAFAASADGAVIDAYSVSGGDIAAIGRSAPVAVLDDDARRALVADVVVNPSLTVDAGTYAGARAGTLLLGPDHVLLRRGIVAARPDQVPAAAAPVRTALVLGGGTDAGGAAGRLIDLLVAASETPIDVRRPVGPGEEAGTEQLGATATLTRFARTPDIQDEMLHADVVLSAAGSAVWELACLGRPTAITSVAPNQDDNLAAFTGRGAALGLGPVDALGQAAAGLKSWLQDADLRTRQAATASALVDGRGAERVADAVESMMGPDHSHDDRRSR